MKILVNHSALISGVLNNANKASISNKNFALHTNFSESMRTLLGAGFELNKHFIMIVNQVF